MRRSPLALALAAIVAWCAVAWAQPAAGDAAGPDASVDGGSLAAVRVLRAGAGAETRDVWLDERRILTGLELGRPSRYVVVPAGRYDLALAPPADDASGAAPSAALGSVDLSAGGYATVVVPVAASVDGDGDADTETATTAPFVVHEPRSDLAPVGRAGLRLVHAAVGRPALAMAIRDAAVGSERPPGGWTESPASTHYVGRASPMRGSDYAMVDVGTYLVWFVGEEEAPVLPEPVELQLDSGALYTVFLAEDGSGRPHVAVSVDAARGVPAQRHGATASLGLLHASPDAPLVDLVVDGELTLRDVAHRAVTSYADVPPGRHLVEVFPHRLPGPMRLAGDADGPPSDGEGETGRAERTDVPRLEPLTVHVDVPSEAYTTLVLAGRYEPPPESSTPGALSVAVEPSDADVTVQGPDGIVASSTGPKLLDGLAPGTYRIEVRKEGHRSARYEVEVRSEGTSVVNVTLQRASEGEEAEGAGEGDGGDAGEGQAEAAAPTFVEDGTAQGARRRLELHVYAGSVPTAEPGRALVRFVHVAPSVPHLEIVATPGEGGDEAEGSADETVRIERLTYPNAGPYLSIPAESQTLTFYVSGSQNRIRRVGDVSFRAGATYTLYLVDRASGYRFEIVPVVDAITPQGGPDAGSAR